MKDITKDNIKEALLLYKNGGLCGPNVSEIPCAKCPWSDGCKDGSYAHLSSKELKVLLANKLSSNFSLEEIIEVLL